MTYSMNDQMDVSANLILFNRIILYNITEPKTCDTCVWIL